MRKFIDIISGKETPTKKATLLEGSSSNVLLLLEGKQWEAMLTPLKTYIRHAFGTLYDKSFVSISDAMKTLRRNDAQVWTARLVRLSLLGMIDATLDEQHKAPGSEFARLKDKIFADYKSVIGGDPAEADRYGGAIMTASVILRNMVHFQGIPYSKIQNYRFGKQTLQQAFTELYAFETEFKEKTKSLLTMQPGDKIVLEMPDNFVWVMLSRGYCSAEAEAMGHCGNIDDRYGNKGDRILSLRRAKEVVDGQTYYESFLTFILNKDGKLGEMKGRGNDKPAARYHNQIVALLKLPIIKGIRGGGYLAQNNFSLDDLPEDKKNELLDSHSHLGTLFQRYQRFGLTDEIKNELVEGYDEYYHKGCSWNEDKTLFYVEKWDDIDEFIEDCGNQQTKDYVDWDADIYETDDDSIESFMDDLPLGLLIKLGEIAKKDVEEAGEDEDDYDFTSTSDLLKIFKEYNDELYDAFRNAQISGEESGAQSEAHKALEASLDHIEDAGSFNVSAKIIYTTIHDGRKQWDAPVHLALSPEDAIKFYGELQGEEYGVEGGWKDFIEPIAISVPSYGFQDFDESSAVERLKEELDIDNLDSYFKKPKVGIESMDRSGLLKWIMKMYKKIPDGYIKKYDEDYLTKEAPLDGNDYRYVSLRKIANSLYKKFYG